MKRKRASKPDRSAENQPTPTELVEDLLGMARRMFYCDLPEKRWFQDRTLIMRNVVLHFAKWLDDRGVTIPPAKYRQIMTDVFMTAVRHGDTENIAYLPGYLATCVQSHLAVHGEDYYNEAKGTRDLSATVLETLGRLPKAPQVDTCKVLAELHDSIKVRGGRKKKKTAKPPKPESAQLDLL